MKFVDTCKQQQSHRKIADFPYSPALLLTYFFHLLKFVSSNKFIMSDFPYFPPFTLTYILTFTESRMIFFCRSSVSTPPLNFFIIMWPHSFRFAKLIVFMMCGYENSRLFGYQHDLLLCLDLLCWSLFFRCRFLCRFLSRRLLFCCRLLLGLSRWFLCLLGS